MRPGSAYKTTLAMPYETRTKMEQGVAGRRDLCEDACKADVFCTAAWHDTAEQPSGEWTSACYMFSSPGVQGYGTGHGMCDDPYDTCLIKTGTGCKGPSHNGTCPRRPRPTDVSVSQHAHRGGHGFLLPAP